MHAHLAGNALQAVSRRALRADLVPRCISTTPPYRQFLLCLTRRRDRCRWLGSILEMVRLLNEDVLDAPLTASQDIIQGDARIGGHVKAMSYLNSIGRPILTAFGVRTGSIARDDLDQG